MKVLGIDPGTTTIGYGIIDKNTNNIEVINYGILYTDKNLTIPQKLQVIYQDIVDIIKEFNPEVLAIEQLFFCKNQKTVITVSEARGVILLAAIQYNLKIVEFTPLQVKQTLTGYGKASKNEVQNMVKIFLNLDKIPYPDDAADALAIALCYVNQV